MHNRKPVDTEDPKNFTKLNKLIYIYIYSQSLEETTSTNQLPHQKSQM